MKDALVKNIRRRRQILGLDQGQMAERIGVSRITFSKYENGKAPISDEMFYRLSRIFGVSPTVLLESPDWQSRPFFRHKTTLTQQERACNEQMILDAEKKFEDYQFLEQVTGDTLFSSGLMAFKRTIASESEARALGTEVRQYFFANGFDSVRRFGEALESNGIKFLTFSFPLASEFGFTLKLPSGAFGIAVNTSGEITGERQLFTLCHEVGHLLMHSHDDLEPTKEDRKRNEAQANAFAAGMLIPKEEFDNAWAASEGKLWFDRVLSVKRIFTVSYQTVIHCLEERYRADTGRKNVPPYRTWFRDNYLKRFGRTLPSNEEACPADIRIESSRFTRLARKAFMAEKISMSRLAELLDKSLLEARALANEWLKENVE